MDESKVILDIGEKLKKIRKEVGLTQLELSKKSGIARSYICDIEKGKTKVAYSKLVILLDSLGFSLEITKKDQK